MGILNSQEHKYPFGKTIPDLFLERVNAASELVALEFENQQYTYRQLDTLSNQLANFLIRNGVKEETLVPICISRSPEMIIGILGILKAGGAYVPIDPEYPQERIAYILNDIDSSIVLSTTAHTGKLSGNIVLLDKLSETISKEPGTSPATSLTPQNLAYIIYTSGSTGKPKGVMLEHQSIVAFIRAQSAFFNIQADDRILQFSNYCFDASVEQIFLALLNGSSLILFKEGLQKDMDSLSVFIEEKEITHLHATPGLLEQIPVRNYKKLRRVISGGDLCKKELAERWQGKADFFNKYGPTETTVTAIEYNGSNSHTIDANVLPIGKPMATVSIYLLDAKGKEVPAGESGEIHIGGIQVARGYLNRDNLTAEKFISNPLNPGERLYKSGDLARQLPDGNIEFLGRMDDQVKIRGYRIELGEIENVLQQSPGVKQCTILAKQEKDGEKKLIGYIVPAGTFNKEAILHYLQAKLPEYMVPRLLMELDKIPLNHNGKVDKKALPDPDPSALLTNVYVAPKFETEKKLADLWKDLLGVKRVGIHDNFFDLGGSSLLAQKTVSVLKQQHQLNLPVTKLYQFPTVAAIAALLDNRKNLQAEKGAQKQINHYENGDIAIIGMAGRFPGSNSIDVFWNNIKEGKESIRFFSDDELDATVSGALKNDPDYVKARGVIDGVKNFDAAFFGINPRHAELMDPQQRIFMEIAWEALERTGYIPQKYKGVIGVYAGCRYNSYYINNVIPNTALVEKAGSFHVSLLNDKDYISTRTAYALDLKGPAVTVQSACSTSLLAVAQAVESIRKGQCDIALAGGAAVKTPVFSGHLYEEGAMLSKDGHCRAFDADAKGTVFSDGAGVVVLKSKAQAEKDGDTIYAVIKGVGISNDGGGKGSFTAPSAEGQAAAITMAITDAGVAPAAISYIETHGTATPLGDPIEIEGLNIAFGNQDKKQFCAIGSVKSNVGHLTNAAGVAGLIKTTLALYYKQIPASINYSTPNPAIDFVNSSFFVNTSLKEWDSAGKRVAGVSSFGVGGTNVHVIVEEVEQKEQPTSSSRPVQFINWSAKNETSVEEYGKKLSAYIAGNTAIDLADVSYNLHSFRQDFNCRRFVVAADSAELIEKIANPLLASQQTKNLREAIQEVVFMFPGQGAQYINMGKDLYKHESVFRSAMDECATILQKEMGENILEIIYPAETTTEQEEKLKNTRYSQPALFTIGYSLAKLWMSWGIHPSAFIGHSIGEFVAAYFAGVFTLGDALKLIAARGKMMSDLPRGSMLSVKADAAKIKELLPAGISLAAVNSPTLCVVAGSIQAVAAFGDLLTSKEISNRLLHTSHAFHSSMMDEVVAPFKLVVESIQLNAPVIPIASTVTGQWLKEEEATNPAYWARHLRSTVLFSEAAKTLLEDGTRAYLEIGPGNVTATLIRQQAGATKPAVVAASLEQAGDKQSEYYAVFKALGLLWLNGISPDWSSFYKEEKRKKAEGLPTYSFNSKTYWVDPPASAAEPVSTLLPIQEQAIQKQIEPNKPMRKNILINEIKDILEDASGIEMQDVTPEMSFIEIGLDSLSLTQVSISLKKKFNTPLTFRQLNEEFGTLDLLAGYLDSKLPPEPIAQEVPKQVATPVQQPVYATAPSIAVASAGGNSAAMELINLQLQILTKQIAMMQGNTGNVNPVASQPVVMPALNGTNGSSNGSLNGNGNGNAVKPRAIATEHQELSAEEAAEIKKPFGAAPRIEKQLSTLSEKQKKFIADLTAVYTQRTKESKAYTQKHRAYMADPRVVSGFRPTTKELVYSIVINKSKGSHLWDIDGNEYIDSLNGFGSNMLGYQPDFIKKALIDQIEKGYEIGPQHELAGEVCKLICEFTNFERSALCNTGSEAVLGAMRIARTVTGRSLIVAFAGSYHGIVDEVIVRSSKKLKTYPAAPGIMPEAVQNMLILEYGTEESLKIIKERAHEVAAVLVEPVQSRRAEFQPIDFLKKLRKITEEEQTVLIFDEVISGFRFHPGGVQAMFGIKADIGTYGKVAGGGISIGIIAGKEKYMNALDGGFWQYGDGSIPEAGVTYFAGTFVRHPLALATAKASLTYLKDQGPQLQKKLNEMGDYVARTLNGICQKLKVPIFIAQFGSLWRIRFMEEYPYSELFFTLMRYKGIHILEGFSCFITAAHTQAEIDLIIQKFEESLIELKQVEFIPEYEHKAPPANTETVKNSFSTPPFPNARLGKDKDGNPAWFIKDEKNPGKYLQVN